MPSSGGKLPSLIWHFLTEGVQWSDERVMPSKMIPIPVRDPVPTWLYAGPTCLALTGTAWRFFYHRDKLQELMQIDHNYVIELGDMAAKEYAAYYVKNKMIVTGHDERVRRVERTMAALLDSCPALSNCFEGSKVGKWRFNVVNEAVCHTISFPSGYIFIHQGLLNTLQSDDELAFVLAHEMALVSLKQTRTKMMEHMWWYKVAGFAI